MFSRRQLHVLTILTALVLMIFTAPVKPSLATGPFDPQDYPSQQAFWAYSNIHPFLFVDSSSPCWGEWTCFIDTYSRFWVKSSSRWVNLVTFGNQYRGFYDDGKPYTGLGKGKLESVSRWKKYPCAKIPTGTCHFTARRVYVNDSGKQREEIFAYDKYWIFDATSSSWSKLLDSGFICASPGGTNSYEMKYIFSKPVSSLPSNISCPPTIFRSPSKGGKRP